MSLARVLVDVRPLRTSPVFRRLLIGRTASILGSFMTVVTVMFQVWDMTHSAVWSGAVGLAQAVPLVVVGLFAGSWVDRGDRRRIFLVATIGQAVCSLLLAVQGFTGNVPVIGILALVAAGSSFSAVGGPAAGVFVPRLLPKDQVAAGLALNQVTAQSMMLIGPALGGLFLGWFGIGVCYLIDALSFGLAFYGAFGLPALPPEGEPSRPGLHGVLDGLRFLGGHRVVRGALITDLAATVLAMPMSLFPLVNEERFGGNPRTLGLFLSAFALGGVTATAFSGRLTRLARPGAVMLCGAGIWGVAVTLFGLTTSAWAGLGLLVVAGAADSVSVLSRTTIVQTRTPDALLGRVTAAELIVGQAGPHLGNVRGGVVAGWTSGATALVTGGLLCVLAVAYVASSTPELRNGTTPE
ncbi:major facilitator transporter [Streptomyces davaonensis JCM 4913]|uniref:Major facilitator transporter n=1 Tax=Streptomyces davaonensis (strain DSM 101723 / JCM 4913 / KCC S-0913 / 768) TaxID=1214101 RepID=K4R9U7_STRDJ|nr:MFS transporter [Streptomyces davaonensis]CCK29912.1 major facilitator transporter [Streptomyces davaonensis JCM 4913]